MKCPNHGDNSDHPVQLSKVVRSKDKKTGEDNPVKVSVKCSRAFCGYTETFEMGEVPIPESD